MALAFLVEMPRATQEQFDSLIEKVGDKSPPGLLFHVDGPIEGGWRIVDVWESQEALDKFFQETLQPAYQELGLTPQVQVWPARHIQKP